MTTTQAVLGGLVLLSAILAIVLGGPVTTWVFAHLDQPDGASARVAGIRAAGGVLRGGQTIGLLERCAVFLAVVAGYPEGVLGVIAVKGLGRFSELRAPTDAAAERFIIGSLTSLLWAGVWAAVARLAVGLL